MSSVDPNVAKYRAEFVEKHGCTPERMASLAGRMAAGLQALRKVTLPKRRMPNEEVKVAFSGAMAAAQEVNP